MLRKTFPVVNGSYSQRLSATSSFHENNVHDNASESSLDENLGNSLSQTRRQTMDLIYAWSDDGSYSRLKAIIIGGQLFSLHVSEENIRRDFSPEQRFAYKKFRLELEDKLELIQCRESEYQRGDYSERTYRKIWILYVLYTKAFTERIWDINNVQINVINDAISYVVKISSSENATNLTTSNLMHKLPSLSSLPVFHATLKNPVHSFLLLHGRFVTSGEMPATLKKMRRFNSVTSRFFLNCVQLLHAEDIDSYLILQREDQLSKRKTLWKDETAGGYEKESDSESTGESENAAILQSVKQENELPTVPQNLAPLFHDPPPTEPLTTASHKVQHWDGKKRICLTGCRYEVFATVAVSIGFEICSEGDLWNIHWSDTPLLHDKIMTMRRIQDLYAVFWGAHAPIQKCNHFPGMYEICRKDRLSRNLNRLKRLYPLDYNFFPETFDLPTESAELVAFARRRKKSNLTFIVKPECGCQGRGIFLVKNLRKLSPIAKCVCQLYLPHPFLIDGYKFDERIYVLITSVDPLRIYIYEEGIARFATVKYEVPNEKNLEVTYMHLTNYSINKFSESYIKDEEGSKRTLSAVYAWMANNGHDVGKLLQRIDEIIIKTILAAGTNLVHNYRTCFPKRDRGSSCFELLGFDIIIDRNLNPYLLEVNHSPSFLLELPVDHLVKKALINDMFSMVYLGDELPSKRNKNKGIQRGDVQSPSLEPVEDSEIGEVLTDALKRQFRHEMKHRGQFRLIYCSSNPARFHPLATDRYDRFVPLVSSKKNVEADKPPSVESCKTANVKNIVKRKTNRNGTKVLLAAPRPMTSSGKGDTFNIIRRHNNGHIIYDDGSLAVGLEKKFKGETPQVVAAAERMVVDSGNDQINARDINNNYIYDDFNNNRQ